ncbi:MAG: IS5 family transposase [Pseudomonadota bacterium]|nr:IS5 family transposase [Pseudomonadota bacterium]
MPRFMLNDQHWAKLKPIFVQQAIYDKPNLRLTVEAMLYRMRVGCPWRDLPPEFGRWNSLYKRYNDWSEKGVFQRVFSLLSHDSDTEWIFIDGSYVKAHQHSAGAATSHQEAVGLSRGGKTSKIHLAVDAYGLPVAFKVTGGEVHDVKAAPDLLTQVSIGEMLIADTGYDSQSIRDRVGLSGKKAVIRRRKNSKVGNAELDKYMYSLRHLVENMFARLKHFRAIATRYDKLKRNFVSLVALACAFIWLPM